MPIVPGGGDRWAGRRALELVIAEVLAEEITDDEARRILGKAFDFVVTPAARRVIAERKAGRVYEAIFSTILEQVSSGDTVFLSGLGAFKLAETAGAGAGAVFPGGGVSVGAAAIERGCAGCWGLVFVLRGGRWIGGHSESS